MDIDAETALFYGFIAILIIVLATLILLLIQSGFFAEINVQTCKPYIGEVRIAYKSARGPYKESGTLFTEVHSLLPQYRCLGVYYDDPRKKEQSRLRYIVGLILSENGAAVSEEDEATLKKWNYKFATFPSINHAVQTSFPFKSTLSIIVAVFRVYPILNEYIELRSLCAYPFIEVYDNEKGEIFFVAPLESQDSFCVPEVVEAEEKVDDDDDDQSTASWDDSASYIKSDGCDSDSLVDEAHSLSSAAENTPVVDEGVQQPPKNVNETPQQTSCEETPPLSGDLADKGATNVPPPRDSDSDNQTASSFEEIDENVPEMKEEQEAAPTLEQPRTEL